MDNIRLQIASIRSHFEIYDIRIGTMWFWILLKYSLSTTMIALDNPSLSSMHKINLLYKKSYWDYWLSRYQREFQPLNPGASTWILATVMAYCNEFHILYNTMKQKPPSILRFENSSGQTMKTVRETMKTDTRTQLATPATRCSIFRIAGTRRLTRKSKNVDGI